MISPATGWRLAVAFLAFVVASTLLVARAHAQVRPEDPPLLSEEWPFIRTGITDIVTFLKACPTNDPIYPLIRQNFELRLDGVVITSPLECVEPILTAPISVNTDMLTAVQAFRTAYYMGIGTEGYLPWTPLGLYDWMAANIAGVNFKTAPGQLYCCDSIGGRRFVARSLNQGSGTIPLAWPAIAGALGFYAHETRHVAPDSLRHTNGCPAFPLPTDPLGCDPTYDLRNLGGYGVQYWLYSKWTSGELNVGIGCAPPSIALAYSVSNASTANVYLARFVTNPPPAVTATQPYGGPCEGRHTATADFDGDARTDLSVFRPSTGVWLVLNSLTSTSSSIQWGTNGDLPVRGDFDGDGRSDPAVFRPSTGVWYVRNSSGGTTAFQWGLSNDVLAPGDYDGDGRTDVGVFRPSSGTWYIWNSSTTTFSAVQWGLASDVPVPGDYDNDARTDVAVFRPSSGTWYVRNSGTGTVSVFQWGLAGDVPVAGDYDGDGATDVAVFRPSSGTWYVRKSSDDSAAAFQWGLDSDVPTPGDYDGDGKTDVAVFRPSNAVWYVWKSGNNSTSSSQWGAGSDTPILKR